MGGVLLTGSTGLVGQSVLQSLLARETDLTVVCLLRAADTESLEARRTRLLHDAGIPPADHGRVEALAGDVEQPGLGLADPDRAAARVDTVVHCAASTRFDLPIDEARRANVAAVRHIVDFARLVDARGGCRRLHQVSTAYVVGDAAGVLTSPPVDPLGAFRNTYEQTKWEAEQLVRSVDGLPTTISRPSIVVGDSTTGRTPHFRVLYEPMKWIYFAGRADGAAYSTRRTNILPCRPEIRLDVVPVDYVADAVVGLTFAPDAAGGTFHLSAGEAGAITIAETVELLHAAGNRYARDRGEGPIDPPVIVSPDMVAGDAALQELYAAGEAVMSAYLPYAVTEQVFDPAATAAALGPTPRPCPHPRDYYDRLAAYALTHNFGRTARP